MAISLRDISLLLGGVSVFGACTRQAKDDEPTTAEVCAALGDLYAECYPQYASYEDETEAYCIQYIEDNYYGDDCGAAYFDYYVCLSELDCAGYAAPTACAAEEAALSPACN